MEKMNRLLDRREFLKLSGLLSLSYAIPRFGMVPRASQPTPGGQNVLLVVFDALSAYQTSLYGYHRQTMPNLDQLAERAIVYHNHFAGGNFTTPGTASLLTGTLPWTHRAINYNGTVDEPYVKKNIFRAFQNHYRIAYSHNPLVNTLLFQFTGDLDEFIPRERFFLASDGFIQTLFNADEDIATVSWARTIKRKEEGYAYSLFLTHLYEQYREGKVANFKPLFPRGLPNTGGDNYFLLEQAIDGIGNRLVVVPQPFFGYFHFLPPHYPYKTHRDFYGKFERDGWKPVDKPDDLFSQKKSTKTLLKWRIWYDEYLIYVDREFRRHRADTRRTISAISIRFSLISFARIDRPVYLPASSHPFRTCHKSLGGFCRGNAEAESGNNQKRVAGRRRAGCLFHLWPAQARNNCRRRCSGVRAGRAA